MLRNQIILKQKKTSIRNARKPEESKIEMQPNK